MKYSVFTVSTPEFDLEKTCQKLKEYGYDWVEWRVTEVDYNINENKEPSFWGFNRSTVDISTIKEKAPDIKKLCDNYNL